MDSFQKFQIVVQIWMDGRKIVFYSEKVQNFEYNAINITFTVPQYFSMYIIFEHNPFYFSLLIDLTKLEKTST